MPEENDMSLWDQAKGILRTAVGLIATAAGVVILYKGLDWIFSLV